MHLPPGTVDYQTISSNLTSLNGPNFKARMRPIIVQPTSRGRLGKKRRSRARQFAPDLELIVFPAGMLAADGSFIGAVGLAAHLERTIRAIKKPASSPT